MAAHKERFYTESVRFVLSAYEVKQLPQDGRPLIALLGRSNVGKSSLINMLLGRKELARVSRTPGRTQAVNVYDVVMVDRENSSKALFYLCDLPGIGYAHLSKTQKAQMSTLLSNFVSQALGLKAIFHLLDARRGVQEEDHLLSNEMRSREDQEYEVVLTKVDHVPLSKRKPLAAQVAKELQVAVDKIILTSTHLSLGKEACLAAIVKAVLEQNPS